MISIPRQLVYTEYRPVKSWTVSKPPLYLSKPVEQDKFIFAAELNKNDDEIEVKEFCRLWPLQNQ